MLKKILLCGVLAAALIPNAAAAQSLGAGTRLFVTKAYPSHDRLTDEDFRQLADAGFNVVVKRWFEADDAAYVDGAAKAGLATLVWRYGLVNAPDDIDRTVTREGKTTRYALPFSEYAWDLITRDITALATLSLDRPSLRGVVLDCEIYDRNKTDGFCESYDDATFSAFLHHYQKAVPDPLPDPCDRAVFLQDQRLTGLYILFQADRLERRVEALRRKIDGINPSFQIGVYGWGVMVDPLMRALATTDAPLLRLNATTYGRTIHSNAFASGHDADAPDRSSLRWSLITASLEARLAREAAYPMVALAGHHPQSPGPLDGRQYRFTVRQCFNSAAYADGYWVWTDAITPEPFESREAWLAEMLAYFGQANAALDAQDWTWSAKQTDHVPTPQTQARFGIATRHRDGQTRFWNGDTTLAMEATTAFNVVEHPPLPEAMKNWTMRVRGWNLERVDPTTQRVHHRYQVGARVRSFVLGNVDPSPGPELVTLGAGWIRLWDPQTQAELLRFHVGDDATQVLLFEWPDTPPAGR